MVSTRSANVAFPLIGKPIDRLSSLKLPTNLEVMQRSLYHFVIVIVITFYSPSCLGQETAKGSFGL